MRSLAEVLLGWGWRLSGSDLAPDAVRAPAASGARIFRGHAPDHLPPAAELVIYSDAVPADNPELRRAIELGVPALSYFQMLGRLMRGRRGLAVAGTHGKSTTTAMTAAMLVEAGLDPLVVYGAAPLGRQSGGRAASGKLMLVEACEYRANFLHLPIHSAVILGIEPDHFDYYNSPRQLEHAFARFAASVPEEGLVLARAGCPATERVTAGLRYTVETFGFQPGADWSARHLRLVGQASCRSPGSILLRHFQARAPLGRRVFESAGQAQRAQRVGCGGLGLAQWGPPRRSDRPNARQVSRP